MVAAGVATFPSLFSLLSSPLALFFVPRPPGGTKTGVDKSRGNVYKRAYTIARPSTRGVVLMGSCLPGLTRGNFANGETMACRTKLGLADRCSKPRCGNTLRRQPAAVGGDLFPRSVPAERTRAHETRGKPRLSVAVPRFPSWRLGTRRNDWATDMEREPPMNTDGHR